MTKQHTLAQQKGTECFPVPSAPSMKGEGEAVLSTLAAVMRPAGERAVPRRCCPGGVITERVQLGSGQDPEPAAGPSSG